MKRFAAGSQNVIYSVLEKTYDANLKEVIVTAFFGGMRCSDMDEDYVSSTKIKNMVTIKVKDEATENFLQNAAIAISTYENLNTAYTDKKGMYKMKGIIAYENYFIRVIADGYEPCEFAINAGDFKDRKKEWEVLLRKQKIENIRSTGAAKPGAETRVRMGEVRVTNENKKVDHIDDISILQNKSSFIFI